MNDNNNEVLVKVDHLTKHFPITRGIVVQRQVGAVQAVDDVTFEINQGETLGLAFDGLIFVNDRWVLMTKPWRSLPE